MKSVKVLDDFSSYGCRKISKINEAISGIHSK